MGTDRLKKDALNIELKVAMSRIMKLRDLYNNMQIETSEFNVDKKVMIKSLDKIKLELEGISKLYNELKVATASMKAEIILAKREKKEIEVSIGREEKAIAKKKKALEVQSRLIDKSKKEYQKKLADLGTREKEAIALKNQSEQSLKTTQIQLSELNAKKMYITSEEGRLAGIREDTFKGQQALRKAKEQYAKDIRELKAQKMKLREQQYKVDLIKKTVADLIKQ